MFLWHVVRALLNFVKFRVKQFSYYGSTWIEVAARCQSYTETILHALCNSIAQ